MCLKPLKAFLQADGRPLLSPEGDTTIPCGKCFQCVSVRAIDFATRAQHEMGDHDYNCAITLTYDDDHVPSILDRQDAWQKFMKRLRKKYKKKILSMVSHEFGSKGGRIHHHAILFGIDFFDKVYKKTTDKGTNLFTSRMLTETWNQGDAYIGEASPKTAFYIASYALKKASQDALDPDTGEIITLKDIMRVSTRPAIGLNYLKRNHRNLVNQNTRLPRYYIKKLKTLQTIEDDKFLELSIEDQQLYRDMYDSYEIYENSTFDFNYCIREKYAQFEIHNQKMNLVSDFRDKKSKTKEEKQFEKYFKEETMSYLQFLQKDNKK